MIQANQKTLQTAFIYGFVSGVALGIGEIILGLSLFFIPYPLIILVGRLAVVLLVLAYLYAGYQAARRTGNLFAGTLAGALTGVFAVATLIFFSFAASFLHMSLLFNFQALLGIPIDITGFTPLLSPVTRVMLTFAFYGAIVGTLGGFVGRRRALY